MIDLEHNSGRVVVADALRTGGLAGFLREPDLWQTCSSAQSARIVQVQSRPGDPREHLPQGAQRTGQQHGDRPPIRTYFRG